MPGKITATTGAAVFIPADSNRAQLDFRNSGAVRVYYAHQKNFTAGEAAYLEAGEGKSLLGNPGYVGKPVFFKTASGTADILYS